MKNRMPVTIVIAGCLFVVTFLFSSVSDRDASAQESPPCSEDIANFCKDVKPGGGRIIACLNAHESGLTSLCRAKLQEVQNRIDETKRVCSSDIEKFCKGIEPGEGRIARCLDARAAELSPACAEKMEFLKAKLKEK